MEVNDELEIDIENKYMNKVVFTLEESIYILKRKDFCDEVEDMALDRLIKYIKEESIPRAVVEEKIEELNEILIGLDYHDIEDKEEREFYKKEYMKYVCTRNEVQEILKESK